MFYKTHLTDSQISTSVLTGVRQLDVFIKQGPGLNDCSFYFLIFSANNTFFQEKVCKPIGLALCYLNFCGKIKIVK